MRTSNVRIVAYGAVLTLAVATGAAAKKHPAGAGAGAEAPQPAAAAAAPGAKGKAAAPAGLGGLGDFSLTSNKEPVEITSEKLDFDYKIKRVIFTGNVVVIQGAVNLQTDSLTVDYDQVGEKQTLKTANAEGHVVITQGPKKATGQHATFDQTTRTMVLTGDAVLEEGSNQVNGDKIVVHPDDSRMEVIGQNRRVKVVLFPGGQKTPTPGAANDKAAGGAAKPTPTQPPAVTPEAQTNGSGESP